MIGTILGIVATAAFLFCVCLIYKLESRIDELEDNEKLKRYEIENTSEKLEAVEDAMWAIDRRCDKLQQLVLGETKRPVENKVESPDEKAKREKKAREMANFLSYTGDTQVQDKRGGNQ